MGGVRIMEMAQLEILEGKINQAVNLIDQLKSENQRLINENNEIRSESQSRELMIQQLKEDNENLKQTQAQSSMSPENEQKIKDKVEQMLKKLDQLQGNL